MPWSSHAGKVTKVGAWFHRQKQPNNSITHIVIFRFFALSGKKLKYTPYPLGEILPSLGKCSIFTLYWYHSRMSIKQNLANTWESDSQLGTWHILSRTWGSSGWIIIIIITVGLHFFILVMLTLRLYKKTPYNNYTISTFELLGYYVFYVFRTRSAFLMSWTLKLYQFQLAFCVFMSFWYI